MRTINATLLANQDALSGNPCRSCIIGTAPNTVDVSSYLLAYDYSEDLKAEGGLTLVLDNKDGHFNSLTGSLAYLTEGAVVEFKRGLTIAGSDYVEELPRCWVEGWGYEYEGGTSTFIIECIDWRGKLARWRAASVQTWSDTSATTILEWILTQVGLTRASGAMTALSTDFSIRLREDGNQALQRLVAKMPEYLYPGLDAEIKWKDIDGSDASVYTFGWNGDHPLLDGSTSQSAWEINSVTVKGKGCHSGTASDATQIAKVGTRKWTIYDEDLNTDAKCAQRATAELDLFEAEAVEATLVCRPCHGLELLDVVTYNDPAWGGEDVVGRVISYREEWNNDGRWSQVIGLGPAPDKDPGNEPAAKRAKKKKKRRRRKRRRRRRKPPSRPAEEAPGTVPIGAIIMYEGLAEDLPPSFALCDGDNGTPDLRDRFIVGAGDTYAIGDTGGADTNDLSHTHGPGTLATDSDGHSHDITGYSNYANSHSHGAGSLNADESASVLVGVAAGSDLQVRRSDHTHDVSGATATTPTHRHTSGSYATDTDNHSHSVTTGATASAGAADQENKPLYYALAFIKRIE